MTDEQKPVQPEEIEKITPEILEAIVANERKLKAEGKGGVPTYAEILAAKADEAPEFTPTPGIEVAMRKALYDITQRSFSGRNPELGKMIKCAVCTQRHRASQVCVQKFKYLHTEEEVGSGQPTDIYATVEGSRRPQGRRRPRPNHFHLQVVELAKDLYGRENEYDRDNPRHRSYLNEIRTEAIREIRRRRRAKASAKRVQQDISRRINRGLLQGGFRP